LAQRFADLESSAKAASLRGWRRQSTVATSAGEFGEITADFSTVKSLSFGLGRVSNLSEIGVNSAELGLRLPALPGAVLSRRALPTIQFARRAVLQLARVRLTFDARRIRGRRLEILRPPHGGVFPIQPISRPRSAAPTAVGGLGCLFRPSFPRANSGSRLLVPSHFQLW